MFNLDPKKMQQVMKQLGMKQEDIPAERVIIECEDKKIIISEPSIQKILMQGQESFQITGKVTEEEKGISEEDINQVAEKTGSSKENAKKALEKSNGDLAEAILSLS